MHAESCVLQLTPVYTIIQGAAENGSRCTNKIASCNKAVEPGYSYLNVDARTERLKYAELEQLHLVLSATSYKARVITSNRIHIHVTHVLKGRTGLT